MIPGIPLVSLLPTCPAQTYIVGAVDCEKRNDNIFSLIGT